MTQKLEIDLGGKRIIIETGLLAKQAAGSVTVSCGETVVLVAVTSRKSTEVRDFFPLTCDYREQTSAAGKIPGGFFKREGRPSEREILVSRLIDRSIRPLFPDDFTDEVQIVSFVFSADQENDPDILSVIGASCGVLLSGLPVASPVGCIRIGKIGERFIVNPTISELDSSDLNLVLSGTENSLVMLEGWAKEISENVFIEAVKTGFECVQPLVKTISQWKTDTVYQSTCVNIDQQMNDSVASFINDKMKSIWMYPEKKQRNEFYDSMFEELKTSCSEEKHAELKLIFKKNLEKTIRETILFSGKRFDGRKPDDVRDIECRIGLLPRTHGSSLFTRGQTQCIASVTLGTKHDQQIIDGLFEETSKRFMLHYNFPPFSVGETGPIRAPSRREIGHGALAERSLQPLIPAEDIFPYTIRIVANILESNGSSSMATVCASSLALMDGGIPLKRHVAGIALGMIKEGERYILLTDIAGEEDHVGDLDLKIAGTSVGITGFQMDVKTTEFSWNILSEAVMQSKQARDKILGIMNSAIKEPRPEISKYAPRIVSLKVSPDKIGLIIGGGGKTIRKIIEETGAEIDIEDDGTVSIYSTEMENCQKAVDRIKSMVEEPEVDRIYEGTVTRIFNFGAMVKFLNDQEGLVHISELAPYRVNKVEDVVNIGEKIKVKFIGFDEQGRANLSRKQALTPEEIEKEKQKSSKYPSHRYEKPTQKPHRKY
ncbi:MAG: Polyribonucleotide nucleotidyltransferase [candidate division TA06 bacterium ADurb.Bin131]|jgi:polyribonucleotide nucleotidyltransferase|uniref:Polyribonucleotide nucleotidyltransferase n=1 Tax=candidate division TA06 bacterium ADurb.Bin131 TaxID=1852827 RepID=A0A1V6C4J2_UNCT6|nr:MAG: Polyribonucleotide nucleotidyltransferase [candidate division TA06 bacterium ADurb.Bin131]HOC02296.1 polyribonucleotide nucleotidyltransferase [bacterium]HON04846.1 polyribonucleotide nucleotidyltransferase [bacterium]HRV03684.1 polyribonucleotide nucleotidyltransferase [Candidatus Ratteibacteria bacterium]